MDEREARLAKIRTLSRQQYVVLALRCQGKSVQEVADRLGVVESTVYFHTKRIYVKLRISELSVPARRMELARFCAVLGDVFEEELPPVEDALDADNGDNASDPQNERAMLAVLEDEGALVRIEGGPFQAWAQPIPEPELDTQPDRWRRLLVVAAILVGVAALGGLIGALAITLAQGRTSSNVTTSTAPPSVTALVVVPTASPTEQQLWDQTLQQATALQTNGQWEQAIALIDGYRARFPAQQAARDTLYDILVAYAQRLIDQGRIPEGVAQLARAQALIPGRSEAPAALARLTPATLPATVVPVISLTVIAPTATVRIVESPTIAPSVQIQTSSTASPAPKVNPGTVLYEADWSNGLGGWLGPGDWKGLRGTLINDGSSYDSKILAPYTVPLPDYAIETEIQFVREGSDGDYQFGLIGRHSDRGGYLAGVSSAYGRFAMLSRNYSNPSDYLLNKPYTPDKEWHRYRLECTGNQIRFLLDGAPVFETTDNTFISGGEIGVWNRYFAQIAIRAFRVIAL